MVDYRNHRRFLIKCLKQEVIPVSVKLKTNIHTTKALQIIRRAEKQLLNECIRSINNMIEILHVQVGYILPSVRRGPRPEYPSRVSEPN